MFGFETLARLHEIPVVRSSTNFVQNFYSAAKKTSVFIRFPCSVAENVADKSLKIALTVASPLVQPLRRPVYAIDEFAAKKLVQFEKKFPVITTTPDDVFESLNEKTEPVRQVVHSVRDTAASTIQHGKEKFSNVANSVLSCRIDQLKTFVLSTIETSVTFLCQSAQSNIIWLRMFIIYILLKLKQTNDFILSSSREIPLLKNLSKRFLICFGSTLENLAERIRPDDRTLSELNRRKSKKFFVNRPRFQPDPSLTSRPDVIDTDQHVSRSISDDFAVRRPATNGNSDIEELHRRVQPTDIEELHSHLDIDTVPVDRHGEPLTEDQADLLARLDATDSD